MKDDKALIVQRVVPAFLDQGGDFRILKKEFVEPGNLRKHLQIGKVLRLEIFLGWFRTIPAATKTLPEFAVAWIAANHVNRIGLEKILQSESTLFGSKIFRWLRRHLQKGILRGSRYVVMDLRIRRGMEMEGRSALRKCAKTLHLPVLIL